MIGFAEVVALSDGTKRVLESKPLTHFEGLVYFFDGQLRLTTMLDSKISSVRIRKEKS
jgi:hypothetical protein